jgi:hypothetical protein
MTDSIENRITTTRSELEATLDAIEDKLNVPKRVGKLMAQATDAYHVNPAPWILGATAVTVVIGGLVAWAIFGDD